MKLQKLPSRWYGDKHVHRQAKNINVISKYKSTRSTLILHFYVLDTAGSKGTKLNLFQTTLFIHAKGKSRIGNC